MSALFPLAAAGAGHDSGAVPTVLLALAFAIVGAKFAGELVERLGQPAVLGELLVGILAGNAVLLGGPDLLWSIRRTSGATAAQDRERLPG